MQLKYFILVVLPLFLLASCTSTSELYSVPAAEGQLLFVRPTDVKTKDSAVKKISFDMTIPVKDEEIRGNPVLNYSLELDKEDFALAERTEISLTAGTTTVSATDKEILFRKPEGKKIIVRYSVTFPAEDFRQLLDTPQPLEVRLDVQGEKVVLKGKDIEDFNSQIDDVRLILL